MKTNLSRTIPGGVPACLLALMALAFTVLPVAAAPHAPQAGAPDIAKIDAYVSAQMQADHIPGVALGLVHNDQIVHLRGFGSADQSGRAVTAHTPFILASVSKSFTALASCLWSPSSVVALVRMAVALHTCGHPTIMVQFRGEHQMHVQGASV